MWSWRAAELIAAAEYREIDQRQVSLQHKMCFVVSSLISRVIENKLFSFLIALNVSLFITFQKFRKKKSLEARWVKNQSEGEPRMPSCCGSCPFHLSSTLTGQATETTLYVTMRSAFWLLHSGLKALNPLCLLSIMRILSMLPLN